MPKISDTKKKFLESIGIDLNNLPPEFEQRSSDMESTLSDEEIAFLSRESTTGTYTKEFCLKDLAGTTHPDYSDKTWLEAFLTSKRGDNAVEQYMRNPDYYEQLKNIDQSGLNHDTPIELYESDGQFYIRGGNNRLSLLMMKYLSEMSKAQTDEERAKIDDDYTFVADVNPTPKDKDIMYMINMIRTSNQDARIERTGKTEQECSYTITIDGNVTQISSKDDLEQYIRESYNIENSKTIQDLEHNLTSLLSDDIMYSERTDPNRARILSDLYPGLQQFRETFIKLRELGIDEQFYEGLDFNHIDFSKLSEKAEGILQNEKDRQAKEKLKRDKEEEKAKAVRDEEKRASHEKSQKASEDRKTRVKAELRKEKIGQTIQTIPENVETTYYELQQEEMKFTGIAKKLGLQFSVTKTGDTNIYANIENIKANMQRISEQVQQVDDISKLDKVAGVLEELETLSNDGTIKTEYSAQLKDTFEKSFDDKVQEMIKSSKLDRLDAERSQIESERISIIGKIFGKGKLKQARLDNIDLKKQLLLSEIPKEKTSYSIEDSLSDLYTYSQCELGKVLTPEMKDFLTVVKTDSNLRGMINNEQLKGQFQEKVSQYPSQSQTQMITNNDRNMSNRQQASLLQVQNATMSRQIQSNKENNTISRNSFSSISVNTNNPLNRFQNNVNEISASVQTRESREVTMEQQQEEQFEMGY